MTTSSATAPAPTPRADVGHLAALAARISRTAEVIRAGSDELQAAVGVTRWHGVAARAFEASAASAIERMRHAADRLDDAARALRGHAGRVDAEVAEVAHLARLARHGLEHAAHDLGSLL